MSFSTIRTANEPLAPRVVRVPRNARSPSWRILTRQRSPETFWSTSNSTSSPPLSGETFSFQSLASLHEPSRITSFWPAEAMPAGTRSTNAVTSANTIPFFMPTSSILDTSTLARQRSKGRAKTGRSLG